MITSFQPRSSRTIPTFSSALRQQHGKVAFRGHTQALELAGACSMIAFFLVLALFG
jgi:hypothetical protein